MGESFTIARRFCGPSSSGNGGYVCGRVARHVDGPATVRLHRPPPLETPLTVEREGDVVRLLAGDELVAEGRPGEIDAAPPEPPSHDQAVAASERYPGFERHSFPRCFVCGPERAEGDGLRIFAGPVTEGGLHAAPWRVDPSLAEDGRVPDELLWAALDCPSAAPLLPPPVGRSVVLGQLTARLGGSPRSGETCLALGWEIGRDGRKRTTGSAVYSQAGALLGVARATWIEVPESAFPAE
jgi:hypothetical protein